MVTICHDWTPRDDLRVCNSFTADYTSTIEVDRDGDDIDGPKTGGEVGELTQCNNHRTNIRDVFPAHGVEIYEDIAWNHGFGFCGNCWLATREIDNYDCDDCGDRCWPFGEDPDEDEDNEEETTATQAAAFIRARQRPRYGDTARPPSRIHALSIPHGA